MLNRAMLAIALTGATAVFGFAAQAASARNLEFTNKMFRVTFRELWFNRELPEVSVCHVTLTGSLVERNVRKVSGSQIGSITGATSSFDGIACFAAFLNGEGGRANTLPWELRYSSFSGTLPIIERVHVEIKGLAFMWEFGGSRCLYLSEAAHPAFASLRLNTETGVRRGDIEAFEPEPAPQIPRHATITAPCATEIPWGERGASSNGEVVVTGSMERIAVKLI